MIICSPCGEPACPHRGNFRPQPTICVLSVEVVVKKLLRLRSEHLVLGDAGDSDHVMLHAHGKFFEHLDIWQ